MPLRHLLIFVDEMRQNDPWRVEALFIDSFEWQLRYAVALGP